MEDKTENIRRQMVAEINENPGSRAALMAEHGEVWDTSELTKDFDVRGFAAPFVIVTRKTDDLQGSLRFQGRPRFYFGFCEACTTE